MRSGILILDPSAETGTPLANYLGLDDVAFEIGVTPNRPDCLSHIGVAREAAPLLKKKILIPKPKFHEEKNSDIKKRISIEIRDKRRVSATRRV